MGSGEAPANLAGETDVQVTMECERVPTAALGAKAAGAVEWGLRGGAFHRELAKIGLRVDGGMYLVRTQVLEPPSL